MDIFETKEYREYKNDQAKQKLVLESEKRKFQNKLLGDMGKDIVQTLNNPPKFKKTTLYQRLKLKYRKWKEDRLYKKYTLTENAIAMQGIDKYMKEKETDNK